MKNLLSCTPVTLSPGEIISAGGIKLAVKLAEERERESMGIVHKQKIK